MSKLLERKSTFNTGDSVLGQETEKLFKIVDDTKLPNVLRTKSDEPVNRYAIKSVTKTKDREKLA